MQDKPNRPLVTRELIAQAAKDFCAKNSLSEKAAEDLAIVGGLYKNGYELAKDLERRFYWTIEVEDIETLDQFQWEILSAHEKACYAWAEENNIQPPFPIGTMTTNGEITGISSTSPASYEIRIPDHPNPTARRIVRFEDAVAAEQAKC